MPSQYYSYYSLLLDSDFDLPELGAPRLSLPGGEVAALRIALCQRAIEPSAPCQWYSRPGVADTSMMRYGRVPGGYLARLQGHADFLVAADCSRVEVSLEPGADGDLWRHFLLDSLLPSLLGQQGRLLLHASAALHDGRALLFAGESGWGKSTLAASWAEPGTLPLADDGVLLRVDANGTVLAVPAYVGARLKADSASHLFPQDRGDLFSTSVVGKTRLQPGQEVVGWQEAVPVAAIFLIGDPALAPWDRIALIPASGHSALMALMRCSFLLDPHRVEASAAVSGSLGRCLRTGVAMATIAYPRTHADLPAVRQAVAAYLAAPEWPLEQKTDIPVP